MELTDTHCHIHAADPRLAGEQATKDRWHKAGAQPSAMLQAAQTLGVNRLVCVGTTLPDSTAAIDFAAANQGCWATVGIHPHEAKDVSLEEAAEGLEKLATQPKVVALGECGLDFYYEFSPKELQIPLLKAHLAVAKKHDLPVVFHVRDAFEDFWPVFDQYPGVRGVIHSFTGTADELAAIVRRGLYVGLNGIMTFTKDPAQLAVAKAVPLDKLVLETDAPFLTPTPYRGKICEPKYVRVTAEFLRNLRGESLESLAAATTRNAAALFKLR